MVDSEDTIVSCLRELETSLHGIYVSLDTNITDASVQHDFKDGIIIRCERLLDAVLMVVQIDEISEWPFMTI